MADGTGIQWTTSTWNPTVGCSLLSSGCTNCYAMKMAARLEAMGQATYAGLTRRSGGRPVWTGEVRTVRSALTKPLSWMKGRRIFVDSMSDLFHDDVPDEVRDEVFGIMAATQYDRHGGRRHTFQVLTKRIGNARRYLADDRRRCWAEGGAPHCDDGDRTWDAIEYGPEVLPHVELLASIENQETADERVPELLMCRAAVRGVSLEPMLGAVDLTPYLTQRYYSGEQSPDGTGPIFRRPPLEWVIIGGESGGGCRPIHPGHILAVVQACKAADVPVFVKQLGQVWAKANGARDNHGGNPDEWPAELRVREFPEARA